MTLNEQLKEELKTAMKAKDAVALSTVRGILAACTNELVATKRTPQDTLSDEEIVSVIKRAVKQRKDSVEQYTKGGRPELAEAEQAEINFLEKYLPATMSIDKIRPIALAKMQELQITDRSKIGMLMGALSKELKGQAEGSDIKTVVDELLSH
jgi:hypothetical protein